MATDKEKELKKELQIALKEIGKIKPWFDKETHSWIFHHSLYPVEYSGDSKEEVLTNYPKYLEVFIEHRIKNKIDAINEKKTKGRGGFRPGSGRPKGTTKGETKQIRLPIDIALWLNDQDHVDELRAFIRKQA